MGLETSVLAAVLSLCSVKKTLLWPTSGPTWTYREWELRFFLCHFMFILQPNVSYLCLLFPFTEFRYQRLVQICLALHSLPCKGQHNPLKIVLTLPVGPTYQHKELNILFSLQSSPCKANALYLSPLGSQRTSGNSKYVHPQVQV